MPGGAAGRAATIDVAGQRAERCCAAAIDVADCFAAGGALPVP